MNKDANWEQVKNIFSSALEIEPYRRHLFVAEQCNGDEELKAEIESWLASYSESEDFINTPLLSSEKIFSNGTPSEGRKFGNYTIIREIGYGGMGAVFLAERNDGEFEQKVALKIVRQSISEIQMVERFRRERQILASLNHPNIAKLLDGGVSDIGEPFIAMEYIEGEPITEFVRFTKLSLKETLRLFLKVCSAVSYAHRNLIVHRDIKPGNILVTPDGEPKLLDFGLAKLIDQEMSPDAAQTQTAFRALTPAYASPEQLRGEPITTPSDIYSLGVVLYELLTGNRPFDLKTTRLEEIIHHISTDEPARPSQIIMGDPQSTIDRTQLTGDLDNIVLMSLRKEPDRRYKSVSDFAEDIDRHLQNIPVSARSNTFRYRTEKFLKRNKIAAASAALIVLAVLGSLIISLWQAEVARNQRDLANAERLKAERINRFLSDAIAYSDPAAAVAGSTNRRDATVAQMLDEFAPRFEYELADQPEMRASLQRSVGIAYISQLRVAEAERYLNAAMETQSKIYGDDHQEIAVTLSGLANVQSAKGEYAAAEKTLQKVISIYHIRPPTEQIHIKVFAVALAALGDTHWTRGDYHSADAAYTESLSFALQLEGRDREFLADSKAGLGSTRYAQGRLDEGTTLLREAITEYRSLPHTRYKMPNALNYLAQTLTWKNEFDEALMVLKDSEAMSLEVLGENNYPYPRSQWLQFYALCLKGDCWAAEKYLVKSEEVYARYFSDNKMITANNYDARNIFLTRTGRAAQGESFGRQSIELYQGATNRGANSITLARIHLAENLIAQKKYDVAETILLEGYKDASEVQGVDFWRTRNVADLLVRLYEILGKKDLAQQYQELATP